MIYVEVLPLFLLKYTVAGLQLLLVIMPVGNLLIRCYTDVTW